jgi:hypothetical protein
MTSDGRDKTPPEFVPGDLKSLRAVDIADVTYDDECIVITGIVSPSGQAGWPKEDRDYEVHCFSIAAWRCLGQNVTEEKLVILRPVPKGVRYFDDFPAYSILRLRVLLSTDRTRAVLDKLLPLEEQDQELLAIGAELRKPVVIVTQTFGDLVFNPEIEWFEGSAEWNGEAIDVNFHPDAQNDIRQGLTIANALKTAEAIWTRQREWHDKVTDFVVKELFSVKNEGWLHEDEDESALTIDDFIKRLSLDSIVFYTDGDITFWYDDGEMFWGHAIEVHASLKDGVRCANLAG